MLGIRSKVTRGCKFSTEGCWISIFAWFGYRAVLGFFSPLTLDFSSCRRTLWDDLPADYGKYHRAQQAKNAKSQLAKRSLLCLHRQPSNTRARNKDAITFDPYIGSVSSQGSALTHTEKTLRPRKGACGWSVGCVNRGTRYGCRCFHRRVQRRKAHPSSAEATYLRGAQQDQRSARWHALRKKCPSSG